MKKHQLPMSSEPVLPKSDFVESFEDVPEEIILHGVFPSGGGGGVRGIGGRP